MKLLVIGGGGREHALAWKLGCSPRVQKVYVAPGNAGTALEKQLENVPITAIPDLIAFAQKEHIAFTKQTFRTIGVNDGARINF